MEKKSHHLNVAETFRELMTDPVKGLSYGEAAARQARDGFNEFEKTKHTTLWQKFISQFKSFMIIVLIFAAIISGITGYMNGEGITDALIILVILIANAIIGVFQEAKAEKSLDALEKLSAPHCKVIRDGETKIIESRELVVGDIVVIETGDNVPADLRLIESVNLKIQEAALTGESVPVEKDADAVLPEDASIGDRINMAYSSCSVIERCEAAKGFGYILHLKHRYRLLVSNIAAKSAGIRRPPRVFLPLRPAVPTEEPSPDSSPLPGRRQSCPYRTQRQSSLLFPVPDRLAEWCWD